MKEITAYIRPQNLDRIVRHLEELGAPGVTVIEMHSSGYGFKADYFPDRHIIVPPHLVKIEIFCHDDQTELLVDALQQLASTGQQGDGRIFIATIDDVVRVQDGARGPDVL
jgi:nitrogen regulatory protein PII